MTQEPLGVGILAAGPVAQAIHLPAVAGFPEQLAVVHVMDVDEGLARSVAGRCPGAAYSTSLDDLLADERVEIVVVGSPDQFHAEQVVAACERGVRLVLCEKPLAVSEAEGLRIVEVSTATGVPVLVGTMHAFDPAWRAARRRWGELEAQAELVRCVARLPTNDLFISAATQLLSPAVGSVPPRLEMSPEHRHALILQRSILGLLIHSIPLIRQLVGSVDDVAVAEGFEPFGSRLVLACDTATVELHGLMPGRWEPDWQLRAWSPHHELAVSFPPSYVTAGSARAAVSGPHSANRWACATNGYRAEWEHVIAVATGAADPLFPVHAALADLAFALDIWRLAEPALGATA